MAKKPPLSHRTRMETAMIRQREKTFQHDQYWNTTKKYYEHWDKKNSKFDEWTSPRYEETNNKLVDKMKKAREHEDKLEKRRDKLRELYAEDEKLQATELAIYRTKSYNSARSEKIGDVPTELLKELQLGMKVEDDERRRHEAELKLYHQWRSNNPVVQHYERMQRSRDLKLSWLDQQIENRMRKEREDEECRRILAERNRIIKEEEEREIENQKRLMAKREELRTNLEWQVNELKMRTKITEELKRKEEENLKKKLQIEDLMRRREEAEKEQVARECALSNVKHYKMKLRRRAENIEESLANEKQLMEALRKLDVLDRLEEGTKKEEIKRAMEEYLQFNKQQRELEKSRQKYLEFLFDSEAMTQYKKQEDIWKQEEEARTRLIKDVFDSVRVQIDKNVAKNRLEQAELVKERQEMLRRIEEYNDEMVKVKEDERRAKQEQRKALEENITVKNARRVVKDNLELKRIDDELERVRKEEARLRQEIVNIQRRQGPKPSVRSKVLF